MKTMYTALMAGLSPRSSAESYSLPVVVSGSYSRCWVIWYRLWINLLEELHIARGTVEEPLECPWTLHWANRCTKNPLFKNKFRCRTTFYFSLYCVLWENRYKKTHQCCLSRMTQYCRDLFLLWWWCRESKDNTWKLNQETSKKLNVTKSYEFYFVWA